MKALFIGHAARKLGATVVGLLALVLMQSAAMAALGIKDTRHNLGSTNTIGVTAAGTANTFSGTAEICIFCHTPHGGDASAAVPLWNRTLANPTSFTRYSSLGTATFDAAEAPVGSVSIACLSCHDGTQAMNVVINAPGSGSVAMTGTWIGTNVNATGYMQQNGSYNFPKLGTDLRDDHPISMQYGGGGISDNNIIDGVVTVDTDFAPVAQSVAGSPGNGKVNWRVLGSGKRVWWVDTGTSGQQKTDLTLYSRTDGSGGTFQGINQPFVECASCHDPHSPNSTFLRIVNTGSSLCLTCHVK